MSRLVRRTLIGMATAAAIGAPAALAGGNIVGPIFWLVHGPEEEKKVYELDKDRTTVVFVDDRGNRVPRRTLRLQIAQEAEKALLKEKVVKDMISAESALAAAGGDRYEKPTPITDIGKAIKADRVVYATVDRFSLSPDGQTLSPTVELRVKVIDAQSEARLWPEDARGYPLTVRLQAKAADLPSTAAARQQAEDELARQTGMKLAQLFYNHERPRDIKVP